MTFLYLPLISDGATGWGLAHQEIQCAYPKILLILFVAPIRVTMMMITTRFSLLCILDFVKEIVEDSSYNPDRSPAPGIPQNTDNLIPGAVTASHDLIVIGVFLDCVKYRLLSII